MTPRMIKFAAENIILDHPQHTADGILHIIKFLLKRVPYERRADFINNIRNKIMNIRPDILQSKKTPMTASLGQAITFLKTVLNGKPADYIKLVLQNLLTKLY